VSYILVRTEVKQMLDAAWQTLILRKPQEFI